MNKPRLIITVGAQGVGKGTITNLLREKMTYTNLLRLSGVEGTSIESKDKVFTARYKELQMIESVADCNINFILDRSHLCEKVYVNLGYKQYDFALCTHILNELLAKLAKLYDVQVVLLTALPSDFSERLNRDKPEFNGSPFKVENSLKQQEEYLREVNKLKEYSKDIEVLVISTSYDTPADIADKIINSRENKIELQ